MHRAFLITALTLLCLPLISIAPAQPPLPIPDGPAHTPEAMAKDEGPAAASSVIDGKQTVVSGDLVVLDGSESIGENFRWVFDHDFYAFETLVCDNGLKLVFAAPRQSGTYIFWLIAADKDANISVSSHVLEVTPFDDGSTPPVDSLPLNEVTPNYVPMQSAQVAAMGWATALADPVTAKKVASALIAVSPKIRAAESLVIADKIIYDTMVAVISAPREGISRYKKWDTEFHGRMADYLNGLVEQGKLKTPADLDVVIQSFAAGLNDSAK